MVKIVAKQPVNEAALEKLGLLLDPTDVDFSNTKSSGFTAEAGDVRIVVKGTGIKYVPFVDVPMSGTITKIKAYFSDALAYTISKAEINIKKLANASDVEMYGAEIELNALVTPNLIAYLQAGYLNSEYGDFEADINGDGVITDNSGLTLRNSPESTFGTGLTYNYNIDLGEFAFHYNYFWRDKYQSIFDNNPLGKVKAAGFHNASIDFTFRENYVLSVYGRNLGNERYARPVLITPVSNFGQYNEPRNYGVELTARF